MLLNKQNKQQTMGTRGIFGFLYKGKYYIVYNHWNSYPSGLGREIVEEILDAIKKGQFAAWVKSVQNLKVVSEEIPPTPEDISKLAQYTNLTVSTQSKTDWYCLLRGCQGSLTSVLNSGYILNHVDDQGKPMYEEYSYIVNLDTNKLDFTGYEEPVSFPLTPLALTPLIEGNDDAWKTLKPSYNASSTKLIDVPLTPLAPAPLIKGNDDACKTCVPKPSYNATRSTKLIDVSTYDRAFKEQEKGIFDMKLKDLGAIYGSDAFPSSWGTFILSFSEYVNRLDEDPNELALWEIGEMTNANGLQSDLNAMKADLKTDKSNPTFSQFDMNLLTDLEYQNLYNFSIAYDKASKDVANRDVLQDQTL